MTSKSGPLAGIQVIELAGYITGPLAGQVLADLGAAVIKVEPLDGDPFRKGGGGPRAELVHRKRSARPRTWCGAGIEGSA